MLIQAAANAWEVPVAECVAAPRPVLSSGVCSSGSHSAVYCAARRSTVARVCKIIGQSNRHGQSARVGPQMGRAADFDLTDVRGIDALSKRDLARLLEPAAQEVEE